LTDDVFNIVSGYTGSYGNKNIFFEQSAAILDKTKEYICGLTASKT
jgi:hypothetical protein